MPGDSGRDGDGDGDGDGIWAAKLLCSVFSRGMLVAVGESVAMLVYEFS